MANKKTEQDIPGQNLTEVAREVFIQLLPQIKSYIDKYLASDDRTELMTEDEVCRLFKKNKSTIWRWRKEGVVKAYKVGGTVYYKQQDIIGVIENNKINL